jgi:HSP20 family protein
MALPVREAVAPLTRIHDEIDRVFQEFPTPSFFTPWFGRARWLPALDLYEQNNNLIVEAELPGIPKEAVKLSCTVNSLTIQGETKKEEEEKREGYYRAERRYGSCYRTVALPEEIDVNKVKAEFKDGVLKVTLPKVARPEAQARTIAIAG